MTKIYIFIFFILLNTTSIFSQKYVDPYVAITANKTFRINYFNIEDNLIEINIDHLTSNYIGFLKINEFILSNQKGKILQMKNISDNNIIDKGINVVPNQNVNFSVYFDYDKDFLNERFSLSENNLSIYNIIFHDISLEKKSNQIIKDDRFLKYIPYTLNGIFLNNLFLKDNKNYTEEILLHNIELLYSNTINGLKEITSAGEIHENNYYNVYSATTDPNIFPRLNFYFLENKNSPETIRLIFTNKVSALEFFNSFCNWYDMTCEDNVGVKLFIDHRKKLDINLFDINNKLFTIDLNIE